MEEQEIWKDIPKCVGVYQASNLGRIKSLARWVWSPRFKKHVLRKERILTPHIHHGYERVTLAWLKRGTDFSVHRLVMAAFHGESDLTVDHIDGDKRNNRLENLRYVRFAENSLAHWGPRNKFGCPGVSFIPANGKFLAKINYKSKVIRGGQFDTPEEAINMVLFLRKKYDIYKDPIEPHTNKKKAQNFT